MEEKSKEKSFIPFFMLPAAGECFASLNYFFTGPHKTRKYAKHFGHALPSPSLSPEMRKKEKEIKGRVQRYIKKKDRVQRKRERETQKTGTGRVKQRGEKEGEMGKKRSKEKKIVE